MECPRAPAAAIRAGAALLALAAACAAAAPCPGDGFVVIRDIPYRTIPGVAPRLLSLDLYRPVVGPECAPAPVMIWVHGGAWAAGDKANRVATKVRWFTENGWILVAVNYRLSPFPIPADPSALDPGRVVWPAHGEDVAAAVAWVHANVASYGGDPDRISLMGHSAGAHIVAALATDPALLGGEGLSPATIRRCVALDTAAYDIPWRMTQVDLPGRMALLNAFGTDPAVWREASPAAHVAPGACLPPFFVVVEGAAARLAQARRFVAALRRAGVPAVSLETPSLTHAEVNEAVGDPADTVLTPALASFLGIPYPPRPPCPGQRSGARLPPARTGGPASSRR